MASNEVIKDIIANSWMVALVSDRDAPQNLFSKRQLKAMREYVASNWSYVPKDLKELWVTPDNVRSGAPVNLTLGMLAKAEAAAKEFFNAMIEGVREAKKAREAQEKQKEVEDKKAKEEEEAKAKEAREAEDKRYAELAKSKEPVKESWFK